MCAKQQPVCGMVLETFFLLNLLMSLREALYHVSFPVSLPILSLLYYTYDGVE